MYKDKLDTYKTALYCSQATLTSNFAKDLQTGTCYKRYGQPADIVGMMLRPILAHKVHLSAITSAFNITIEKEVGVLEDITVLIDGDVYSITTDKSAKEVLGAIKYIVEDNTDFYVDIYANGLYAYSYSDSYSYSTSFEVLFSGSGTSDITSMEGVAESTLLAFWNCLDTDTVVEMIEFANSLITNNTNCN